MPKGRWDWFVMGLLLAGTIWSLTALLLAKPDSIWGRAFYGGAKMAGGAPVVPGPPAARALEPMLRRLRTADCPETAKERSHGR